MASLPQTTGHKRACILLMTCVDYFGCKRNNTDLTQAFINTPCAFYYNHTTAHVLLQYRSATYTTFLPSLKYTLIQTECNKTKSKHLKASKCLRTCFAAKEIIRTNSEKKPKHQRTVQLNKRSINVLLWVKPNASQNIIMISRWHFPHSRRT